MPQPLPRPVPSPSKTTSTFVDYLMEVLSEGSFPDLPSFKNLLEEAHEVAHVLQDVPV